MSKRGKEQRIRGIAASSGIAIGIASKHELREQPIIRRRIRASEVKSEQERLQLAVDAAKKEVERIRSDAAKMAGPQLSKIFEAQILILDDSAFLGEVAEEIRRSKLSADYVYDRHVGKTLSTLAASDDHYLRGMAADIKAIAAKVLSHMTGPTTAKIRDSKGRVVLADSFSPGEVVLMHKYNVPGFASIQGAVTSHAVLVARSLSIPAVVGVRELCKKCPGDCEIIIDGDAGMVIIDPDPETLAFYRDERRKRQGLAVRQFRSLSRVPNVTRDGRRLELLANIDFPSDTDHVLAAQGVGVGLYRTEFFYLSTNRFPSEERQTEIYRDVARTFFPNSVTMRVFDLGSDKMSDDHLESQESNPAMGWRGIRFDLDQLDIFRTQVRAILRASDLKNLKIMLPMISSANEIVKARRIVRDLVQEFAREGIDCDEQIEVGIMVEVPSAALMAPSLARHADFFSIGTNDLVQYTLAVDRGNRKIAKLYRELHPSILRLISMTVDAAREANIPVSLCGELASKLEAVPLLIGMGLQTLSVAPRALPPVKRMASKLDYRECVELAERVMRMSTPERVEALLRSWLAEHASELKVEV